MDLAKALNRINIHKSNINYPLHKTAKARAKSQLYKHLQQKNSAISFHNNLNTDEIGFIANFGNKIKIAPIA